MNKYEKTNIRINIKIVDGAIKILETENSWTKAYYARDKNGGPACITDDSAVCFCIHGAFAKSRLDQGLYEQIIDPYYVDKLIKDELNYIIENNGHYNFRLFNDDPNTEHYQVLHVLKQLKRELEKYSA